jgi:hypothetical protein
LLKARTGIPRLVLSYAKRPTSHQRRAIKRALSVAGGIGPPPILGKIAQKTRVKCFVFGRKWGNFAHFGFSGCEPGAAVRHPAS